jgi:lysozyme
VTTASTEGARFLATHEGGIRLQVYKDEAGNDTVGIGHLVKPGEDFSKGITREKALELFREDTAVAERAIDQAVKVDLEQNQHDALVSFIFNVGAAAFRNSTLLEKLNDQDFEGASKEFERWIRAGGKVSTGLKTRRKAEKELFLKGAE